MTVLVTEDEVLALHDAALRAYGGMPGLRDAELMRSALSQPFVTFGGSELYPTLWDKIAALGRSLVSNHAFVDGNKRVGFAAMAVSLRRNGFRLDCSADEGDSMVLAIATQVYDREEIAEWLQEHAVPIVGHN